MNHSLFRSVVKLSLTPFILLILVFALGCNRATKKFKHENEIVRNERIKKDTARIHAYFKAKKTLFDQKALQESMMIDYSDGVVEAALYVTASLFEQGKFDSCNKYFDIAYKYAARPNFKKDLLPKVYLNHGTAYFLQGDYTTADSLFYVGLTKTTEQDAYKTKFDLLYNLYFTKYEIGQKKLALQYIIDAQKLSEKYLDSSNLRMAFLAKADYFIKEKQIDSAQLNIDQSISMSKGQLNLDQWVVAGAAMTYSDSPIKAIPILNKGLEVATRQKVDFYRIELYRNLGMVYNRLGKYHQAELILAPIITEAIQKGFKYQLKEAYTNLAEAYEKQGKYGQALAAEKSMHLVNDSLLNLEKVKALYELEVKYKTVEKDKQLTLNNLKISQQQNKIAKQTTLLISICAGVIVVAILFFLYTLSKKHQVTSLKQQQEIDKLRSKIEGEENERQRIARELHDGIGGMLFSLLAQSTKLVEENPFINQSTTFHDIKTIIQEIAGNVREITHNLMPDPIIKLGLAEAITQYCFSLRKAASVQINFQSFGHLNPIPIPLKLVIYRIVQELMHNILKHSTATEVLIQLAAKNGIINITVEDNGNGFDSKIEHAGSGLQNIQKRVENFCGKFYIESRKNGGTSINIDLPILI